MKTMKKVISTLLLVCMLASVLAVSAYAAGESIVFDKIASGATVTSENINISVTAKGLATDRTYKVRWFGGNFNWSANVTVNPSDPTLGSAYAEIKPSELGASGQYTITAELVDITGGGTGTVVASAPGYVTTNPAVEITSVTMTPNAISLNVINNPKYDKLVPVYNNSSNSGITPNSISWWSDDESVATVENGVVHAKKPGTTKIWVKVNDNTNLMDSCTVTVSTELERFTLSKTQLVIEKGNTEAIVATVVPADVFTVTWSSKNPDVAKVDNAGNVTAVAAGTTVIYATAGGVTRTCDVTVTDPSKPTVTITGPKYEIAKGETVTYTASFSGGASGVYIDHWSADSNAVSISYNGSTCKVTGLEKTSSPVTLTAYARKGSNTVLYQGSVQITVGDVRTITLIANPSNIAVAGGKSTVSVSGANSGEVYDWTITPSSSAVMTSYSTYAQSVDIVGGNADGYIQVTATLRGNSSVKATTTVSVLSEEPYNATISPSSVTWSKGQGNLEFTLKPYLYDAYLDGVLISGSQNSSKFSYVWSGNFILKSSYLQTLSAGTHTLKVRTTDNSNGTIPNGIVYATITINGTASAAYGDNAHVRGNSNNLYFNSTGAIKNVYISNQLIDPANYTLDSTGRSLTLKANFLNLLNYGTYTMKLETTNGTTETTTFRIVTANYAPATGDESNLALWIAVMIVSGAGAIALIPRRKKEM